MNILITGSSGLVGKRLSHRLLAKGHTLSHLSTSKSGNNIYHWNPAKNELDESCLDGIDAVIHLAGANIFSHAWTEDRKKEIIESRVKGIEMIRAACERRGIQLKHFISASGVGFYGNRPGETVTEEADLGKGFAAEVCQKWEAAAHSMSPFAENVSVVRIGIVLAREGGFLWEMRRLSKFQLLAPLGSGKQMISWIHIDDLCEIFVALIEGKLTSGVYNGVSPNALSNRALTHLMNKQWGSIRWPIAVPGFMLQLILGSRAVELLGGQNASARRLMDSGFLFQFPEVSQAIQNLS